MTHQLHTIKSQDDCSEFLGWLQEHPEITNVQGWYLVRNDNNWVFQFSGMPEGYGSAYHWAVVEWMYQERRMLNDFIRTVISKYPCATCSCFSTCLMSIKSKTFCNVKEVS